MLEKSHIYDEIDRYLRGEMSTEESNAFEKELATNQELRARLHIVEDVKEGLHRRAEKLEKIQSWKETEVKGQSKRPRRVLLATLSVAAAVIAVITLSFPRSGGVMAQEEFSALCALACGSGKVHETHMERAKGDTTGLKVEIVKRQIGDEVVEKAYIRVEKPNLDPKGTYETAIKGIVNGPKAINSLDKEHNSRKMITAAQSNMFHALKNKNYEEMGKMVADGLKMNNEMLNGQKGFTSTFCAGVDLINKAMQAMSKNEALKNAVEKNLDPSQLQIAKSFHTYLSKIYIPISCIYLNLYLLTSSLA